MVTGLNRSFQSQHIKHIITDGVREALQLFQCHIRKVSLLSHTESHSLTHNFVSVTERHAFLDQIIRQIRRGRETALGRYAHVIGFGTNSRHHVSVCFQAAFDGVDRVEQRFLVFLIVLVVRQRLAFHQHEQGHQMAGHPSGFAPDKLRYIGVFFLRHDRRAGAKTIGQINKVKLC